MIILLYHRVVELQSDPQWLCVPPPLFAEQLEALRRLAPFVPLREVLTDCAQTRSIAITFDDGYADNLEFAAPIMVEFRAPATVFVAAGSPDREFWWDELDALLLQDKPLPTELRLEFAGETRTWTLDDAATSPLSRWNVTKTPPSTRHALYRDLCSLIRPLPYVEQDRILDKVAVWAGQRRTTRATHRRMTNDDLRALASQPTIEIGTHTLTHPLLSAMSPADQSSEICDSKRLLEAAIAKPVHGFSYPFGTRNDYGAESVRLVREAGYQYACANHSGRVSSKGRWNLPRYLVRDWSPDELAERVREWLE